MADNVNRVWVSMDLGNFNVGKKTSLFVGADNVPELMDRLYALFGEGGANNVVGHFSELTTEDAFDNLKAGGLVGGAASSQPAAPKSDGPVCQHGPKQLKHSKPGAARKWSAWMCPAPQGTPGQCTPEWL
jgi:hypothetical protein